MQTRHALLLLCLGPAACALNTRPGDGLVSDGVSQSYQFGTTVQPSGSNGLGTDELIPCKNLALFVQHALPHLIERCVECHDGTKLKGSIKYFLGRDADSALPDDQAFACGVTLSSGVTLENRLQSKIFTESDPSRPDVEHEFKFPDPASFAMYRDAVMMWLQTE